MAKLFQLDNGLRVILEPMPYLKTAAAGIWLRAGSCDETKETNGIAHMVEHMLFQGTENRSAKELAAESAAIGDDLNAYTSEEYTAYYGVTVSDCLPKLLELLADMLLHPKFAKEDIRKEKKVILEEIDMYKDSPEDLVHELLQKEIWKTHPLGFSVAGTKERVKHFQREDLIAFWSSYYIPERMVLSIAGAFEENVIFAQIEELFGAAGKQSQLKSARAEQKAALTTKRLFEEKKEKLFLEPYVRQYPVLKEKLPIYRQCICTRNREFEQLHINLAVPAIAAGHRDSFAFSIINSVLGGSNNSRLFQTIREELGLAYSVYSYGSAFLQTGLWHIDITVNPSQGLTVLEKLAEVIKKLSNRGITKEELDAHRRQLRIETILGNEGAKARMSGQAKRVFVYGRVVPLEEWLAQLEDVTLETANEFAASYLKSERASLCLVGPAKEAGFLKLRKNFETLFYTEQQR